MVNMGVGKDISPDNIVIIMIEDRRSWEIISGYIIEVMKTREEETFACTGAMPDTGSVAFVVEDGGILAGRSPVPSEKLEPPPGVHDGIPLRSGRKKRKLCRIGLDRVGLG